MFDVSVVVIAFNERARIGRCLAAILDQETSRSFEIVVVDDGSTDGTAAEARRVAHHVGRPVRLVTHRTNLGRGAARRSGIAAAAGTDIAFVDADIAVPRQWLERLAEAKGSAAAASGLAVPDGDVAALCRLFNLTPRPVAGSGEITGNNVLFDGAVIRSLEFPPTRLGEDFRLARNLKRDGHRLVSVGDLHVHHDESRSWSQFVRWLYDSGKDATSLLAEYRELRTPDLVWIGTDVACAAAFVAGATAGLAAAAVTTTATFAAATVAATAAHMVTRFEPRPPSRFLAAAAAHSVAMGAYLAGRNVGLVSLATRRTPLRRALHVA